MRVSKLTFGLSVQEAEQRYLTLDFAWPMTDRYSVESHSPVKISWNRLRPFRITDQSHPTLLSLCTSSDSDCVNQEYQKSQVLRVVNNFCPYSDLDWQKRIEEALCLFYTSSDALRMCALSLASQAEFSVCVQTFIFRLNGRPNVEHPSPKTKACRLHGELKST